MGDTFRLDLKVGGTLAPSSSSPSAMRLKLPEKQKIIDLTNNIVAVFVETSGTPRTLATASGVIKRDTVTTTFTEQGAGKTMAKLNGVLVIVEALDPASASSGYVAVGATMLSGAPSSSFRMTDGPLLIANSTEATSDISVTLDFTAAVNKKATVYFLGHT